VTLLRILSAIVLGLPLGLPAGCRSPALRVTDIPVAKDASFDLLPPSALGQAVSLEQIVDARYGDRSFSFHCLLEVDAQRLVLVGMTPFNTRAFTLELTDEEFTVDIAPGAQLPAEPSRILADLQLALWPDIVGLRGLEPRVVQNDRGEVQRVFLRGGEPVIQVTYDLEATSSDWPWVGTLVFEQLEQQYTLTVKTVRAEKLAP
jgi:hypothetical protein